MKYKYTAAKIKELMAANYPVIDAEFRAEAQAEFERMVGLLLNADMAISTIADFLTRSISAEWTTLTIEFSAFQEVEKRQRANSSSGTDSSPNIFAHDYELDDMYIIKKMIVFSECLKCLNKYKGVIEERKRRNLEKQGV